jgi:uncharacterized membrane protein YeaQ/YmgE (transglycosylase-associated protein family)
VRDRTQAPRDHPTLPMTAIGSRNIGTRRARCLQMLAVMSWFGFGAAAAFLSMTVTGRASRASSFESVLTGFCGAVAGGASVGHGGFRHSLTLLSVFMAFFGAVLFLTLSILLTPREER